MPRFQIPIRHHPSMQHIFSGASVIVIKAIKMFHVRSLGLSAVYNKLPLVTSSIGWTQLQKDEYNMVM